MVRQLVLFKDPYNKKVTKETDSVHVLFDKEGFDIYFI